MKRPYPLFAMRLLFAGVIFCALPVAHKLWGEPYSSESLQPLGNLFFGGVASAFYLLVCTLMQAALLPMTVAHTGLGRRALCSALMDVGCFAVLGGLLVYGGVFSEASRATTVSLASIAPDGRFLAEIVEKTDGRLDRNFFVRILDLKTGATTNIYNSPDEGPPGTERIVWSADGSRLLLVGNKFLVDELGRMPDGHQLYLLYDFTTGSLKCNASQDGRYEGFGAAELDGIDWREKVEP